jgi:hypothetical protein
MPAASLLEKAASSPDHEVRGKAADLLRELDLSRGQGRCRRAARLAAEGRLDLLPEHTMRWGSFDPEDISFKVTSKLAAEVFSRATARLPEKSWLRRSGPQNDILVKSWSIRSVDVRGYRRSSEARIDSPHSLKALLAAESVRARGVKGIFLTSGGLSATGTASGAIIIANGDVDIGVGSCSIIISEGTVTAKLLAACVVIAAKGIRQTEEPPNGKGVISVGANCVLISGGKVEVPGLVRRTSHVEEDVPRPLGIVRWFDPSDTGLSLDGMKVRSVAAACPLAEAGLRAGDTILEVDGLSIKDAEALRRALRRRFAIGGTGSFTISRGGETLVLQANLGE